MYSNLSATCTNTSAFYWSCTLAGVHDAKARDLRDWDTANKR